MIRLVCVTLTVSICINMFDLNNMLINPNVSRVCPEPTNKHMGLISADRSQRTTLRTYNTQIHEFGEHTIHKHYYFTLHVCQLHRFVPDNIKLIY